MTEVGELNHDELLPSEPTAQALERPDLRLAATSQYERVNRLYVDALVHDGGGDKDGEVPAVKALHSILANVHVLGAVDELVGYHLGGLCPQGVVNHLTVLDLLAQDESAQTLLKEDLSPLEYLF